MKGKVEVVQVALPGRMQPPPQVLMAYKSLGFIFYSAKERLPGEHTGPTRVELCMCVFLSLSVNCRKHFRIVC